MRYQQLNHSWNADPNAPEPHLGVEGQILQLEFQLNAFQFAQFQEGDRACLTFYNCCKYSFNSLNDEGYYSGQHRYSYSQLPWGEFYQLFTNWQSDFSPDAVVIHSEIEVTNQKHFIFFLRDNTFECAAEKWGLELS